MATTITGQGYETMNGTTELGEFDLTSPLLLSVVSRPQSVVHCSIFEDLPDTIAE